MDQPQKLLDWVRDALRLKHYSYRTEKAYLDGARRKSCLAAACA
jgi:hypothetical protein